MSRHGYSDDIEDQWQLIRWRGAVSSAIRGKRGQAFLKEMLVALDALPEKKLVAGELVTSKGEVCAIGSVMVKRGIDATDIDPEDYESIACSVDVAEALVQEIEYINDEAWIPGLYPNPMTDEKRWEAVRRWVAKQIKEEVSR